LYNTQESNCCRFYDVEKQNRVAYLGHLPGDHVACQDDVTWELLPHLAGKWISVTDVISVMSVIRVNSVGRGDTCE
jgi:hypothetical protein